MTALSLSTSLRRIAQELASCPLLPAGRAPFGRCVRSAGEGHSAAAIAGVAALAALLLIPIPALAAYTADGQWYPSPDQPLHHYWFRTEQGVPAHPEVMDPRVEEIAEAFGRGDYAVTRQLAQTLLDSSDDPGLRAEAAAFIVESHIAEGDLAAARSAAEHLEDAGALTRVKEMESAHAAEVARLEQIAAGASDPATVACARVLIARSHQIAHRLDQAVQSYWQLIREYPDEPDSSRAVLYLTRLYRRRGEPGNATSACYEILSSVPESYAAVGACRAMLETALAESRPQYHAVRARFRAILEQYPGTEAAFAARFAIGKLYAHQGIASLAEREWQGLLLGTPRAKVAEEVLANLAELLYRVAHTRAAVGESEEAIRCLMLAVDSQRLPYHSAAVDELCEWLQDAGNHAEARSRYLQLAHSTPYRTTALDALVSAADCLLSMGLVEEALAEYKGLMETEDVPESVALHCREAAARARALLRREAPGDLI